MISATGEHLASEDRIYKALRKVRKSGDNIKVKPLEVLLKTCHSTTAFRIELEYIEMLCLIVMN